MLTSNNCYRTPLIQLLSSSLDGKCYEYPSSGRAKKNNSTLNCHSKNHGGHVPLATPSPLPHPPPCHTLPCHTLLLAMFFSHTSHLYKVVYTPNIQSSLWYSSVYSYTSQNIGWSRLFFTKKQNILKYNWIVLQADFIDLGCVCMCTNNHLRGNH